MAKIHIHIAMILIIFAMGFVLYNVYQGVNELTNGTTHGYMEHNRTLAMQYGQEVTPDEMSFKAGYYEGYTQWKLKKYMNSTN